MNLWTGIITPKLKESVDFYVRLFDCAIIYSSDWFVLLQLGKSELGLMLPHLETQAQAFQAAFEGSGLWLAIDVEDVEAEYTRLVGLAIPIEVELRDEPWGDRHFVLRDPNGIPIDVVQHLDQPDL